MSRDFIEHGYDLKRLHRTILNSRTYQLSWRTNETNRNDERLFSTRIDATAAGRDRRRCDAAGDGRSGEADQAGEADERRRDSLHRAAAAGLRARLEYSMLVFGKPIRKTNCDCERQADPSLLQAVYLRNDADLQTLSTSRPTVG